jgi:C4-type Zn-finger protein
VVIFAPVEKCYLSEMHVAEGDSMTVQCPRCGQPMVLDCAPDCPPDTAKMLARLTVCEECRMKRVEPPTVKRSLTVANYRPTAPDP